MDLLIKDCLLVDPISKLNKIGSILIDKGVIVKIGEKIDSDARQVIVV